MKKLLTLIIAATLMTACGNDKTATITQDEFKKLKEGMTIDEVKKIIGGVPEDFEIKEDNPYPTIDYTGENGVEDFSMAHLYFADGKLETKNETGLLTKKKTAEKPKEPVKVERSDEINNIVKAKVKADYDSTSFNEISVNKDMGEGEGYIVLAHLSFDRKNRANTAKDMISMYAQDLGASLADQPDINEVTVFFEVPYLKEGDNIYKLNMQRSGDGMAIKDEFTDPNIFD